MTVHVYVGPTLAADEVRRHVPEAVVHPPVAHGDVLRERFSPRDVVVIVDGLFHQAPSIRHKEILSLLAGSVAVVGCSSMGALRAAELHPYGMVGHGVVFGLFRDGVLEADDEVTVAHTEGPDYRRLSEPLVNIRHVTSTAVSAGMIGADVARSIVSTAAGLHYTRRSWRAVELEECRREPGRRADFRALAGLRTALPGVADVKAADAVDTLLRLRELAGPAAAGPRPWAASPEWRSRFLYDWQATFSGTDVGGVHVGDADVIRYQQAYHPDFPLRWREHVLDRTPAGAGRRVPARAAEHWLTPGERARLGDGERDRRVLVRSYRPPRLAFDLIEAFPDLVGSAAARHAVAESAVVNAAVAARGDRRSTDHLSRSALREHLARRWSTDPLDPAALDAAARDRGLGSAAEACEAVRPFFLREHLRALPAGGTHRARD